MSNVRKLKKKSDRPRWQYQMRISWNALLALSDIDGSYMEDDSQRWSKRSLHSLGRLELIHKLPKDIEQKIKDRANFVKLTARGKALAPFALHEWKHGRNINEHAPARKVANS